MISELSHAKINLFLNIVGKRADGYHLLESLFAPLRLADEISVEDSRDIICIVDGADIENNTAIKAAEIMKDRFSIKKGATIRIKKNIPMASGLGGSSTNAATTIKLLSSLWDLELSYEEMHAIALLVGADCPFFLTYEPAFVSGIGENIKPVTLDKDYHLLLVNPGYQLTSKDVYQATEYKFEQSIKPYAEVLINEILNGHNSLEKGAIILKPNISNLLQNISEQEGVIISRMSGSGATCFGIFSNKKYALKAQEYFGKYYWTHYEHLKI